MASRLLGVGEAHVSVGDDDCSLSERIRSSEQQRYDESKHYSDSMTAWLPDLIYTGGKFESGLAMMVDERGVIARFRAMRRI